MVAAGHTAKTPPAVPGELVVLGNGMVGHRLLTLLAERGGLDRHRVTVFGEEPRPAYDRVNLTRWFDRRDDGELALATEDFFTTNGIELLAGDPAVEIDRERRVVRAASGRAVAYDRLVLATGSSPFVPLVAGRERPGVFVYRTLDDLAAIDAWAARPGTGRGVVIGGGLLGLEAAAALQALGLDTHVVEVAPHLMPAQLDQGGGEVLRARIEQLGVTVHTGAATELVAGPGADGDPDGTGPVRSLRFAGGGEIEAEMVVFSAGIRPRDELARASGLDLGERGGVAVDDRLRTSDPAIWAIGECAAHRGPRVRSGGTRLPHGGSGGHPAHGGRPRRRRRGSRRWFGALRGRRHRHEAQAPRRRRRLVRASAGGTGWRDPQPGLARRRRAGAPAPDRVRRVRSRGRGPPRRRHRRPRDPRRHGLGRGSRP